MTRVIWGMPVALAFAISSLAHAQDIEVYQEPAQQEPAQQPTQPAEEQAPAAEQQQQQQQQPQTQQTQPSAEQQTQPAAEQQTQPAEAQPPRQPQQQQQQQQQPMTKTQVQLNQLPPAVQSAVRTEVGNGVIEDIEKDREKGQTVYEVEYVRDGIEYEADFAEDGRLLDKDED